ncbi:hypothetical protein [Ramlibacter alkalitolerans]
MHAAPIVQGLDFIADAPGRCGALHAARVLRSGPRRRRAAGAQAQVLDPERNPRPARRMARLMLWLRQTTTEKTMTALRTTLAFNGPMSAERATPALATRVPGLLKNMVLFLASPFIGLAYAVLLPFVGLGMLLWCAIEGARKPAPTAAAAAEERPAAAAVQVEALPAVQVAAAEETQAAGSVAMLLLELLAAPFAGLAFVIALPFVALGALAWTAGKAAFAPAA